MFLNKLYIGIIFAVITFLVQTGQVFAYQIPNFTSCVNPQGEVKVNYESGTHGIVGSNASYEGKDTVYTLSANALTQCFCAAGGEGIQTNWWKISQLTESEIEALKSQGWIYVPNGSLWGLEDSSYMALNSDFSCKGSSSGGSGGTSNSNSSNSGSGSGSSVNSSSGGIGQVLGLASTGNSVFLLGTALTSGLSLLLGLILKKRAKNISKQNA